MMNDNKRKAIEFETFSPKKKHVETQFERLPNEIIYQIFDYLEGCEIFKSFNNLNLRFQQLITSPFFPLKIFLNGNFTELLRQICQTILQPHQNQICSFQLTNCQYLYEIFNQFLSCSTLTHLKSLSLLNITPLQILICFSSIELLTQLVSLTIQFIYDDDEDEDDDEIYYTDIFMKLLSLSSVKYLHISIEEGLHHDLRLPLPQTNHFCSIETFVLTGFCDIQDIISILRYTPLLRYFSCSNLYISELENDNLPMISVSKLTSLIIHNCCDMEFIFFERFIQKIAQQIEKLRIDKCESYRFIYPQQWEQLITRFLPKLTSLKLTCEVSKFRTLKLNDFPTYNHISTSKFYSSHQWILQLKINPACIIYTICSRSDVSLIKPALFPMDLSINYPHTSISQQTFLNILRSFLKSIEFIRLNLFWNCLYGDHFIQLMNFLPKLQVLYLETRIYFPQGSISISDANTFRSVNQLKQISLSMSFDLEYLNYLTIFFPYLKYLKLNQIKSIDLLSIVIYILQRISSHLKYLQSIRLQIIDFNSQIIDQLKTTIWKNKLYRKYVIRHMNDIIYIQCNI